MYLLLVELLNNKTLSYFLKLFNKYVNADNQVKLVKKEVYGHKKVEYHYGVDNNHTSIHIHRLANYKHEAFGHFLTSKDKKFDYNTLMCSTIEEFNQYNVLELFTNGIVNYRRHLNNFKLYLKNNPINFNILDKITEEQFKSFYNGAIEFEENNIIINCPEYELLFNSLDKHETSTNKIVYKITKGYFNMRLTNDYSYTKALYNLHKMGFNFNIYKKITPELLNKYCKLNDKGTYNNANELLFYVIFGNTIGQKIPKELKDTIYKICNNSEQLTCGYNFDKKK